MNECIKLGLSGFKHLHLPNDFVFIVNGTQQFECNKVVASFLSPKVSSNLLADLTIDHFYINVADPHLVFSGILNLCILGIEINYTEIRKDIFTFLEISKELGNVELCEQIENYFINDEINEESDIITRLLFRQKYSFSIEKEVCYISENLEFFSLEELKGLNYDTLVMILSSDQLIISDEDLLLDMVLQIEPSLIYLIHFENLSYDRMNSFINNDFSLNDLNLSIWHSICERFKGTLEFREMVSFERKVQKKAKHNGLGFFSKFIKGKGRKTLGEIVVEFEDQDRYSLNGILYFLTKRNDNMNIHSSKLINITSSGNYFNHCYDIVNFDWESHFFPKSGLNSYVCIDFKSMKVMPTKYSIKWVDFQGNKLLHWILEGTNDCANSWNYYNGDEDNPDNTLINHYNWTILDSQDIEEWEGDDYIGIYQCYAKVPYQMIRIRLNGPTTDKAYYLGLTNIEFFGSLYFEK